MATGNLQRRERAYSASHWTRSARYCCYLLQRSDSKNNIKRLRKGVRERERERERAATPISDEWKQIQMIASAGGALFGRGNRKKVTYRLVQKKGTVLLSTSLAWPAVAGCSWAETFSQLGSISFAQPCSILPWRRDNLNSTTARTKRTSVLRGCYDIM